MVQMYLYESALPGTKLIYALYPDLGWKPPANPWTARGGDPAAPCFCGSAAPGR